MLYDSYHINIELLYIFLEERWLWRIARLNRIFTSEKMFKWSEKRNPPIVSNLIVGIPKCESRKNFFGQKLTNERLLTKKWPKNFLAIKRRRTNEKTCFKAVFRPSCSACCRLKSSSHIYWRPSPNTSPTQIWPLCSGVLGSYRRFKVWFFWKMMNDSFLLGETAVWIEFFEKFFFKMFCIKLPIEW